MMEIWVPRADVLRGICQKLVLSHPQQVRSHDDCTVWLHSTVPLLLLQLPEGSK